MCVFIERYHLIEKLDVSCCLSNIGILAEILKDFGLSSQDITPKYTYVILPEIEFQCNSREMVKRNFIHSIVKLISNKICFWFSLSHRSLFYLQNLGTWETWQFCHEYCLFLMSCCSKENNQIFVLIKVMNCLGSELLVWFYI